MLNRIILYIIVLYASRFVHLHSVMFVLTHSTLLLQSRGRSRLISDWLLTGGRTGGIFPTHGSLNRLLRSIGLDDDMCICIESMITICLINY